VELLNPWIVGDGNVRASRARLRVALLLLLLSLRLPHGPRRGGRLPVTRQLGGQAGSLTLLARQLLGQCAVGRSQVLNALWETISDAGTT